MTNQCQKQIETGREKIERIKARMQSFCPQKTCAVEVYEMWGDLPSGDEGKS